MIQACSESRPKPRQVDEGSRSLLARAACLRRIPYLPQSYVGDCILASLHTASNQRKASPMSHEAKRETFPQRILECDCRISIVGPFFSAAEMQENTLLSGLMAFTASNANFPRSLLMCLAAVLQMAGFENGVVHEMTLLIRGCYKFCQATSVKIGSNR